MDRRPASALPALFRPFSAFVRAETIGGTLLLVTSVVALVWANSPWRETYAELLQLPIELSFAGWSLQLDLLLWINDLLMAFFFLLVGMEIKRELLMGELNSTSKALLPALAAAGGMVVPALIFTAVAHGGEAAHGWGIPMATDIAFALGVLRMLGNRIPRGLFAFLAALAIIDDLGAILVIAIFYSSAIAWGALGLAALITLVLVAMNRLRIARVGLYLLVGVPLWLAVFHSGIHATIAGVILALCIPATGRAANRKQLAEESKALADRAADPRASDEDVDAAVGALRNTTKKLESPLSSFEHALNPYVSFLIVPLFGLANAGVTLVGESAALLLEPGALGVILGLVLGKPIGVVAVTLLAVKLGLAQLPSGVSRRHLYGAGVLAGIGFTMSLFVAGLAYDPNSILHTESKIGILTGSLIAGLAGFLFLRGVARPTTEANGGTDPDRLADGAA